MACAVATVAGIAAIGVAAIAATSSFILNVRVMGLPPSGLIDMVSVPLT